MKIIFFLFFVSLCFNLFPQSTGEINYEQKVFDQDTCCWRKLADEKKYKEAANLLVNYLDKSKMIRNRHALNWHAGQMFAMDKDYKQAKRYFKKTYSIFYKWFGGIDGKTWYYYAKGTVAFINRDKNRLESIIKHWKSKLPLDKNYEALTRLSSNWNTSYEQASEK